MAGSSDVYDLGRFEQAQADDYELALSEIASGRKRSHWMWYIFPQIDGLAFSSTSRRYAIKSLDEARAYLDHPILGPRLRECRGRRPRRGPIRKRDLRLPRRPETQILCHALRVCIATGLGVRASAHEILSGQTRRQDAPTASDRPESRFG